MEKLKDSSHLIGLTTLLFCLILQTNLSAQCADAAEVATNGKCAFLSWTTPPSPYPPSIDVGGVIYNYNGVSGGVAEYKDPTASGNCSGSNNNYTGNIEIGGIVCTYVGGALTGSAPLPVELVDFRAIQNNESVKLIWITESELNNDGFQIEKSMDGIHWKNIGWENGAGTSNQNNEYSFLDNNMEFGNNFYRLKQIDFDGAFEFSKIISVNIDFKNQSEFSVFPNPANEKISLTNLDLELTEKVSIYNSLGKEVMDLPLDENSVDISNLKDGIYYVVAIIKDQKITKKLMVK